jgi:hypothetical protein
MVGFPISLASTPVGFHKVVEEQKCKSFANMYQLYLILSSKVNLCSMYSLNYQSMFQMLTDLACGQLASLFSGRLVLAKLKHYQGSDSLSAALLCA